MVDVLYSLVGGNKQLDQLVLDPLYIRYLDMTSRLSRRSIFVRSFAVEDEVLDKICHNILPQIFNQVCQLILEQHSMVRVLRTINYPQLSTLSLVDLPEKILCMSVRGKGLNFV